METAQRLVAYLFSLDKEDEELLALTVSALNSVAERSGPSVLAGISSSRIRLVEEVRERMKNASDEVGGGFPFKFRNDIQGFVTFLLMKLPQETRLLLQTLLEILSQ